MSERESGHEVYEKNTGESGKKEWKEVRLKKVLSFEYGDNLPSSERNAGDVPVYGANGQVGTHSEASVNKPGVIIGRKGSIAETVFSNEPFWPIDTTYYISNDETDENLLYIHYLLDYLDLDRFNAASAIPGLNRNDAYNLRVKIATRLEQQKIASILHNVDQAIQKTEEIIEQTRRVKKGLMQDLFAKGYYNHKEYQESRTGPLKISKPKDWSLETISDTFKIIDGDRGKAYPSADEIYKEGYCLFLNAGNVTSDGLKFDETEFVTRNKDEELRKGKLERGDLIVTTRGTVGNVGFYSSDIDYDHMRINSGMIILRPKVECNHKFFYYLFNSEIFQKQIENVSYGTAQPQISVSIAQNLAILVPSLEEQNKITEILDSLDEQIQKNEEQLEHLHRIKIGLMQDLLTGKVRTKDRDIEVLDEVLQVEKS